MLHIITGPPAAGKTTYLAQHAKPGDIRIDLDHIANLLAGVDIDNHDHTGHVLAVAKAARQAAIDTALTMCSEHDVWLIQSKPTPKQHEMYEKHHAEFHHIDPGKHVVMARVKAQRPTHMLPVAASFYDKPKRALAKTDERGYGHKHQQNRERMLRNLRDGTPCDWCGKPMYKDPAKNFDGAPLEAEHSNPQKYAENKRLNQADRLLHRFCNRSKREGRVSRPVPQGQTSQSGSFSWGATTVEH